MRSLSFVDKLTFESIYARNSANMFAHDVDDDLDNEIIIGNWDTGLLGARNSQLDDKLVILKYNQIFKSIVINMLSAVSAGRILPNSTLIVATSYNGRIYLLDAKKKGKDLYIVLNQKISFNVKDVIVLKSGIIATAHSDRIIRTYRYNESENYLDFIMKWDSACQIGRITSHFFNGQEYILASQSGGGFLKLEPFSNDEATPPKLIYYPPKITETNNSDTRTWILGDVWRRIVDSEGREVDEKYIVLCIADGTVQMISTEHNQISFIWNALVNTSGEVFGLSKVRLAKEATEDTICICSWNGMCYFLNHKREILRFQLGQSCQAFTTGLYAVEKGRNEPVLIFSTCDQKIIIYYNLKVDFLQIKSFIHSKSQVEQIKIKLRSFIDSNDDLKNKNIDLNNQQVFCKITNHLLYELVKVKSDEEKRLQLKSYLQSLAI